MPYALRFLSLLASISLLLTALVVGGPHRSGGHAQRLAAQAELVRRLGLTDLCLFTEAPYTRHLTMATTAQPFLDHPLATAHFPTGSIVAPPAHLLRQPQAEGRP